MLLASQAADMTPATGLAIAVTGMVIVFLVLVLISLALTSLPRVLAVVNKYYPEKPDDTVIRPIVADAADHEVVAAAAFAMHRHRGGRT